MPIISISIPDNLLEKIDDYIRRYGYTGRSEFVREALREYMSEKFPQEFFKGTIYSIIIVLTSHGQRPAIDKKIIDTMYLYQTMVKSFYHQLLGEEQCINIIVVESTWRETQELVKTLRKIPGVNNVWLIPIRRE